MERSLSDTYYRDEDRQLPTAWVGLVAGGLYLFLGILWTGVHSGPLDATAAPELVRMIAVGSLKLSQVHFWVAAVMIGIGCTLSADTVLRSLRASLLGIAILAVLLVVVLQWDFVGKHADYIQNDELNGTGVFVALVFSTPTYLFLVAKPLLLGTLSVALVAHIALSLFKADHSGWLASGPDPDAPLSRGIEIGAGLAILGFIVLFTFGGAISSLLFGPPTPEEIVAELEPPLNGRTVLSTESGRHSTHTTVERIGFAIDYTAEDPCDRRQRSWLRTVIDSYFRRIRMIEDGHPGQALSSYSERAVAAAETSLAKGYVTWDELAPYTLIHLSEAELAQKSRDARAALACS